MATLKKRLHKYNGESYDVIHFETEACLVKMSDGTDAESAINNKANATHSHTNLVNEDKRAEATTPGDYYGQFKFLGIKDSGAVDLNNDTTGLVWLFGIDGWVDATGGPAHEIAFTQNGIYWRKAINVDGYDPGTWGVWNALVTDHGVNPRTNYDNATKQTSYNPFIRSGGYNIKDWDFNDLIRDGIYECGSDTVQYNTPYGNGYVHFFVVVFCHATSWVRQVAYDVRANRIYTRTKTNDNWNNWSEIITSGVSNEVGLNENRCVIGAWEDTTNGYINATFDSRVDGTNMGRIQYTVSKTNPLSDFRIGVFSDVNGTWSDHGLLTPVQVSTNDIGAGSGLTSNCVYYVIE